MLGMSLTLQCRSSCYAPYTAERLYRDLSSQRTERDNLVSQVAEAVVFLEEY